MRNWKHRCKHLLMLILTVSLVGSNMDIQMLATAAEGGMDEAETAVTTAPANVGEAFGAKVPVSAGEMSGADDLASAGESGTGTAPGTSDNTNIGTVPDKDSQDGAENVPAGMGENSAEAVTEVLFGEGCQWILQEGGYYVLESPSVMTAAEGEGQERAADFEAAEAALLAGCRERAGTVDMSAYNITLDEVRAFISRCVNYNPELFYVKGTRYSYSPSTSMVSEIILEYDPNYPPEEVENYNRRLEEAYAEAIPNEAGMSDVQKARALHDYLAQHVEYDTTYQNHNAYHALVEGRAVCQGYSLAYAALLEKAGIEADYCMASESMNHMWNYVKIDDAWYHVDVTWDDPLHDRAGYVGHKYFLVSDGEMGKEGESGHHDWTDTRQCDSTLYDNAYWQQNDLSAIFYVNGAEYYLRAEGVRQDQKIALICRRGEQETVEFTLPGVWYVWNGINWWNGYYARLSYYNGKLYFNDSTKVYSVVPGDKQPKVVYTYDGDDGYLYGSFVCEGQLTLGVATSPNVEETRKVLSLPGEPIWSVGVTAAPENLTYGYQNSSVLTAETAIESGQVGEFSYQWYRLEGSDMTETAIAGATGKTYTVEKGLNAGAYGYRVKATAEGLTKQADIVIEVAKAEGMLENKAEGGYGLSYVYQGTPIANPEAGQFESHSSQITFTWYQGSVEEGNQLAAAPVNAGNYVLRVKAEATENIKEAQLDLSVKIAKANLTVTPLSQTIHYGGSIAQGVEKATFSGLQTGDKAAGLQLTTQDQDVTQSGSIQASDAVIENGSGQEVSANYEIIYGTGVLTILKSVPTLQIESAYGDRKTYDGTWFPVPEQSQITVIGAVYEDVTFAWYQDVNGTKGPQLAAAPVDAGVYWIVASIGESKNTEAVETEKKVEILPAGYQVTVAETQNILAGVGTFTEPSFTNAKGEKVPGHITYTYDNIVNKDYKEIQAALAALKEGTSGKITYTFTPDGNNYQGTKSGEIQFSIKDIEFLVAGEPATALNAVLVKTAPTYGDDWSEIVKIGAITAKAGEATDSEKSHFTLDVSGMPGAGNEQIFKVLYHGTLNGKTYQNVEVCSGKVDVARRIIGVSAGSYKVSKVYDGTVGVGVASGAPEITNILAADQGVKVLMTPVEYRNPNVGGQASMTVSIALQGDEDGNYGLANTSLEVPCEILPKSITPSLEVKGTYQYTGSEIFPTFAVKDGGTDLADSDYRAAYENHINAGEGRISVYAAAGGNYTWEGAVTGTFTIEKVQYQGPKTKTVVGKYGNTISFDLASWLPEGYKVGTMQVADQDHILSMAPVINGSELSLQLANDRTKINKTAEITIPVTETANYTGFDVVFTVQMADKSSQTDFAFDSAHKNVIYGTEDFVAAATGAVPGSQVTYGSSDPSVATVDDSGKVHVFGVGTVQITAVASETQDYISSTVYYTLNISPKELVWDVSGLTAVDKEGTIVDKKASLYGELKVSGILDEDAMKAVFDCTADKLAGVYDGVTPGSHIVRLSWADGEQQARLLGEKSGNYILPKTLPELSGRINGVSDNLFPQPESSNNIKYKLEVEQGISKVPEKLNQLGHMNTPAKMEAQVRLSIQKNVSDIGEDSIVIYDVTLLYQIGSQAWQKATAAEFPKDGLTITIPYPSGTGYETHDFIVTHLFTEDMNGYHAGDVEYPEVTKTEDGIRFVVYGLSPITVGWTEAGRLGNLEDVNDEDEDNEDVSANENISGENQQSGQALSPATGEDGRNVFAVLIPVFVIGAAAAVLLDRRRKMK